jgi:hypothetical protein
LERNGALACQRNFALRLASSPSRIGKQRDHFVEDTRLLARDRALE